MLIALLLSVVHEHSMRYRLHGVGGSLMKAGMDPQEAQLRMGMSPLDPQFGTEPPSSGRHYALRRPTQRVTYRLSAETG